MNEKDFNQGISDLTIIINETLLPLLLKRDWEDYLEDIRQYSGDYGAFDCMQDEVNRLYRLIDWYEKLQSEEKTIRDFWLFMKSVDDGDDELSESEEEWIQLFINGDKDGQEQV